MIYVYLDQGWISSGRNLFALLSFIYIFEDIVIIIITSRMAEETWFLPPSSRRNGSQLNRTYVFNY